MTSVITRELRDSTSEFDRLFGTHRGSNLSQLTPRELLFGDYVGSSAYIELFKQLGEEVRNQDYANFFTLINNPDSGQQYPDLVKMLLSIIISNHNKHLLEELSIVIDFLWQTIFDNRNFEDAKQEDKANLKNSIRYHLNQDGIQFIEASFKAGLKETKPVADVFAKQRDVSKLRDLSAVKDVIFQDASFVLNTLNRECLPLYWSTGHLTQEDWKQFVEDFWNAYFRIRESGKKPEQEIDQSWLEKTLNRLASKR